MAKNWRLAVCTRWRPLVGTVLCIIFLVIVGYAVGYLQLDNFIYSSFAQYEEVGPWVKLGLIIVLPFGLPLVALWLWCMRVRKKEERRSAESPRRERSE